MTTDKEQLRKEITENIAMQAYFKNFNQYQVDDFVDSYIRNKKRWLEYAGKYITYHQEAPLHWVATASNHLPIIQQKKLFDVQCLWRAEKIELPGVIICADFRVWEHDILNCPFLEPISREDIELYAQYLLRENPDTRCCWGGDDDWQKYDEIIKAYHTDNENRNFPEWYHFYNGQRGTGTYMALPDIRGQKEAVYINLANKQQREEREKDPTYLKPEPYNASKFLSYFDATQTDWFVKTFETKQVQELYDAWQWKTRNRDKEEELEYYIHVLMDADEPVSMPANYNWQDAIKQAANSFANKKIAETLPEAWEQYMMKKQMNIAFSSETDHLHKAFLDLKKFYEELLLHGRKLSGEPEDFNF